VNEQGTNGVVKVVAVADLDVLQRLHEVNDAPRIDVHPQGAEKTAEKDEIVEEVSGGIVHFKDEG
jgi:hypothetical protein